MRPHDILILLKIIALGEVEWLMKDLASQLDISASEVTESLNRSVAAQLIAQDKKTVMCSSLLEFLRYGIRYVYPAELHLYQRGMPTAYSAAPLNKVIASEMPVVWPYGEGTVKGLTINPLYKSVPKAAQRDLKLYELLALTDAMRVGKAREMDLAFTELQKRMVC